MNRKDIELIGEQYRLIYETPTFEIPKNRGTVRDDEGIKLKDMNIKQLTPNIVLFFNPHETFFTPAGFFHISLTADEEIAAKLKAGELDPAIIPPGGAGFGQAPPFQRIWKQDRSKGILGLIQGEIDDEVIYIDFMTVRSPARRNQINSKLIEFLKAEFPGRKLETSKRTPDGEKFWKSVPEEEKGVDNK